MKIIISILASTAGAAAILAASSVLVLGKYDTSANAIIRADDLALIGTSLVQSTDVDAALRTRKIETCVLPLQ